MKILRQLILVVLFFHLTLACRKEQSDLSAGDLKTLSHINEDTTFVDENGKKWEVHVNKPKIEDIGNSINGEVKYAFSMDNGEHLYDRYGNISKTIYKDIYYNDSHKISIEDDSLAVGEVFRATIWSKLDKYFIDIEEPRRETVNSKINEEEVFEFTCSEKGTYNFIGNIKSDSTSFSFVYKFIVN